MFSAQTSTQDLNRSFISFADPEEVEPWKGVFTNSLRKVLEQVHPSLTAGEDALEYVERLIIQLLSMLCLKPSPHSISDVEDRVRTTFPTPIDKWALDDAKEALEKYKRRNGQLVLPVERVHQMLQKEVLQYKLDMQVIVFIVAVLEYISADLFKLTGNYVKNTHHAEITCQDIRVAMCADKVLSDMFTHNGTESGNENDINIENSTYEYAVKDFIHDEKQHLRNLNMINKVFLEEINNVLPIHEIEDLQNMFQNLNDISDLTFTIVASFEDILEMSEDKQPPLVGSCLEEFAEDEEFEVYSRYTADLLQANGPNLIIDLLSRHNRLDVLPSAGQGFREAVKYYLPRLLRYPIWHCLAYFDYIKIFQDISIKEADKDDLYEVDRDNLEQLEGLLKPLQADMTKLLRNLPENEKEYGARLHGKLRHTVLMEKINEMKRTVDGFESKYSKQFCTELLREDFLMVQSGGKRAAERRATLFDGILVLCKRKRSAPISSQVGPGGVPIDYKLKDIIFIRKVEIKDRDDTDEVKNAFEIVPRDQLPFTFLAKSYEEKCQWMSDLVMLNIRCMLDRSLNSVLDDIERKNPLQMPPVEVYRFAEPDSSNNIVFEGSTIKGATLMKLIERLTFHVYTDAQFDRTFLITYRTFVTAEELLELLIERYNVPEALEAFSIQNTNTLTSKVKEDIKRYRKQYYQPIKFRVLNVLKRWVDCYFFDFENNVELSTKLDNFLDSISEKSMKKWAICIKKILQRKKDPNELCREVTYAFDRAPPPIEWHIMLPEEEWNILTLHPVEIARQLTLIEYDMYKVMRSSELVGAAWTKENKELLAPNVKKIIQKSNNFSLWLEKIIVETENLEERVAIYTRLLEIMSVLLDLNNFNGVFSIFSALMSACVYRLRYTTSSCPRNLQKVYNEVEEFHRQHQKKYLEKLHTLNPPCVPFFGVFLTKLIHTEEGNADFINDPPTIINFSKRRFTMEIINEIQQFQDKPYCLTVEPRIRTFLETKLLSSPFEDLSEADFLSYLYDKSLFIEPKEPKIGKPPSFPRKWPKLNLKSPGIKLRGSSQSYKSSHTPSLKPNVIFEDDHPAGGVSPGVVGCIPNSKIPRQLNLKPSPGSMVPMNTSSGGPFSPSTKEFAVFTPIFFGPGDSNGRIPSRKQTCDMISSNSEESQTGTSMTEDSENGNFLDGPPEGPPLPPRRPPPKMPPMMYDLPSPNLPPRDISPPPLPPRRDSLHIRQSSVDTTRIMFEPMSPFLPPLSGVQDANGTNNNFTDSVADKRHFDFISSFNNYNSSEFDNGSDSEMSPDTLSQNPLLFPKHSDLLVFDDIFPNQNHIVEETNDQKTPPCSTTNAFFPSSMPQTFLPEWSAVPKIHPLPNVSLPQHEDTHKPVPRSIIIRRTVPSMFQFNVNRNSNSDKSFAGEKTD
ncbi:protein son of sevenless-like [Planococcus citri]|uniref:protein son of sevenless-like n=1 Tax=Planococcus citri TaxID=170843 RepID=UPI0031F994ED